MNNSIGVEFILHTIYRNELHMQNKWNHPSLQANSVQEFLKF